MKIAKNTIERIRDTGGMFSLVDMIIAAIITMIMTIAVASTMLGTARAYVAVADQALAQGNAKWALDRMKEEILQAWPIDDSSNDRIIMFTKHGVDLDSDDPANAGDDTVCYKFEPPNPTPTGAPGCPCREPDYDPGSVWRGVNTGDTGSGPVCANPGDYRRITDNMTDIRSLKFEYCVPAGLTVGEYDCAAAANNPCVWQVVITLGVARRFLPGFAQVPGLSCTQNTYYMKTTVRPRNIYLNCFDSADTTPQNGIADALEGTWAESI
ncbi:MAG: hypothetical protein ABIH66_12225 [bacterium]